MNKIRQGRIEEQIRTVMGELFLRELRDPRLHGVTVTDVRVDRELQFADIYVSALGDESREPEVMAGLKSAVGFLRREIAGLLQLRTVPILRFHWDPLLAQAEQINRILDELDIPPSAEEE